MSEFLDLEATVDNTLNSDIGSDMEQSDSSEKHEDSEKPEGSDNDEESICLSDFDHNAVDNQDSDDMELENALPAGYAAALVTKNKNFGKSLNTKPLKRTTDAIDDVETLREQKKRKILQLQAELQQDEPKAPYDQDVQILKVAASNKSGKLITTPTHKNADKPKKKTKVTDSKKSVRSMDDPGLLVLGQEVMVASSLYSVTYAGKECPLESDGKKFCLENFDYECLSTLKKVDNDKPPTVMVAVSNKNLAPIAMVGKMANEVKKSSKIPPPLRALAIDNDNVLHMDDGRVRMLLPRPIYTNIARKPSRNTETKKTWIDTLEKFDGQNFFLKLLSNQCTVGVQSLEDMEKQFGGALNEFLEWQQAGNEQAIQSAAAEDLGRETLVWFITRLAVYSSQGRDILLARAKELRAQSKTH